MIDLPTFEMLLGGFIGIFALGALVCWRLLNELMQQKKRVEKLERAEEVEKRWQEAEKQAANYIKEAEKQAENIIGSAETLRGRIESQIKNTLLDVVAKENEVFKETMHRLHEETGKKIDKNFELIFTDTKTRIEAKIEESRQHISEKTDTLLQKLISVQSSIESELADYRVKRLRTIDTTIEKMAAALVKQSLGDALSDEEQEKLVLKALEKAKKSKMFESKKSTDV